MDANRRFVACCILITELCERLTYYSIGANLTIFLADNLSLGTPNALVIYGVFVGTSYFVPVVGGIIADSVSGSYNAIFGAGLIYVIGSLLLPTAAFGETFNFDMDKTYKQLFFLIGLFLVAIGTGGIKSNVGPFGAHQLEDLGQGAVQSFFRWFYWFINVGSAIAFALVAYIQQEVSYFYGYLIPACCMVLAVIVFVLARNNYRHKPPEGSVLSQSAGIVWEAAVTTRKDNIYRVDSFMDRAKKANGGSYTSSEVEDVKSVGRVIPIFLTFILYWMLSGQFSGTVLLQAQRMDLQIGTFTLPAASLNLFNTIIILILVPLVDIVIFPLLEKCHKKPTPLQRIGFGFVLAASSLIVCGVLEVYRKDDIYKNGSFRQEVGKQFHNASHMSVLAQVPQFVLFGASEVFASVTGLEFAFSQSPAEMNGLVMGLFLSANGFGNYIGSALVAIVNAATAGDEWLPDELNNGHADYFFFLLAGLMFVNFLVYVAVAVWYKYVPSYRGCSEVEDDADLLLKVDGDHHDRKRYGTTKAYGSTEI